MIVNFTNEGIVTSQYTVWHRVVLIENDKKIGSLTFKYDYGYYTFTLLFMDIEIVNTLKLQDIQFSKDMIENLGFTIISSELYCINAQLLEAVKNNNTLDIAKVISQKCINWLHSLDIYSETPLDISKSFSLNQEYVLFNYDSDNLELHNLHFKTIKEPKQEISLEVEQYYKIWQ